MINLIFFTGDKDALPVANDGRRFVVFDAHKAEAVTQTGQEILKSMITNPRVKIAAKGETDGIADD